MLFVIPVAAFGMGDQYTISFTSFTALLLVANLQLLINTRYITIYNIASVLLTSLLPYYFLSKMANANSDNMEGVMTYCLAQPRFYVAVLGAVGACSAIEMGLLSWRCVLAPTWSDRLRIMVKENLKSVDGDYQQVQVFDKVNGSGSMPSTSGDSTRLS